MVSLAMEVVFQHHFDFAGPIDDDAAQNLVRLLLATYVGMYRTPDYRDRVLVISKTVRGIWHRCQDLVTFSRCSRATRMRFGNLEQLASLRSMALASRPDESMSLLSSYVGIRYTIFCNEWDAYLNIVAAAECGPRYLVKAVQSFKNIANRVVLARKRVQWQRVPDEFKKVADIADDLIRTCVAIKARSYDKGGIAEAAVIDLGVLLAEYLRGFVRVFGVPGKPGKHVRLSEFFAF